MKKIQLMGAKRRGQEENLVEELRLREELTMKESNEKFTIEDFLLPWKSKDEKKIDTTRKDLKQNCIQIN